MGVGAEIHATLAKDLLELLGTQITVIHKLPEGPASGLVMVARVLRHDVPSALGGMEVEHCGGDKRLRDRAVRMVSIVDVGTCQ